MQAKLAEEIKPMSEQVWSTCTSTALPALFYVFTMSLFLQFATLNKGIAGFYDESSALWEHMWGELYLAPAALFHSRHLPLPAVLASATVFCFAGEHMHHGYYPQGAPPKSNAQAQIDMIEETLRWAGATSATSVSMARCMLVFVPACKHPVQSCARMSTVHFNHLAA